MQPDASRNPWTTLPLLALLAAVAWLAGCGGGSESGGDEGAGAPSIPGSGDADVDPEEAGAAESVGPQAPGRGPLAQIVTSADVHDFGSVWAGAELAHEFEFEAGGEVPLRIVAVKPDCGCTLAHLEQILPDGNRQPYELDTEVAPGTRFALAITFDTVGRNGGQSKAIRIYANVPGGVRNMTVAAEVRPFLEVEPRQHSLGQITIFDRVEKTFKVRSVGGETYRLEGPTNSLPEPMEVSLVPVDPGDDGRSATWEVTVSVGENMPKGSRNYSLHLRTDLVNDYAPRDEAGQPVPFGIDAMVHATVVGAVSVQPQNLNFGLVGGDQTVARTVRLTPHEAGFALPEPTWEVKPFKEGASTAFQDTLKVTARPAPDQEGAWDLELLLDGLGPEVGNSFYGRLVIETGPPPGAASLQVTLSGIRSAGS